MVQLYSRTIKTINGRLLGDRFRTNIMIHYNQQGQTHNVKGIEIKERGQQNGNVQWIKKQVICRISGGKQKGEFRLFTVVSDNVIVHGAAGGKWRNAERDY